MCDDRRKNIQRLPTLLILTVGLIIAYLACGCVSARYAFAEEGSGGGSFDYAVVYGPASVKGFTDYDDPTYWIQVYSPNRYEAALIALGYDPTSSAFTSDVKAYLSNSSTAGAFYTFAQNFNNNVTNWGDEFTTDGSLTPGIDVNVMNMETALRINNDSYGSSNVWCAEYTTSERISAVTAVGLVLSGSIGGGGNEPVEPSDDGYIYLDGVLQYTGSPVPDAYKDVVGICIRETTYNSRLVYLNAHEDTSWFVTIGGTMNGGTAGTNFYTSIEPSFGYMDRNTYIEYGIKSPQNYMGSRWYMRLGTDTRTHDGKLYLNFGDIASNDTYAQQAGGVTDARCNPVWGYYYGRLDGSGGGDVVPPTNWPDPPENPTVDPPSVPQPPTDEPIQQPTDTPIQPPNVWMPIAGTTDPTFTVDLQGVLDAMSAHCQHIRDNLDSNFAQLYNNMTDYWSRKYTNFKQFLDGQFGYIGDTIVDKTDDLMDYLEDLFEWLAEQFDWSVSGTGYNDNTVVSWLRRIYNRLGGGTTIRPPDPVVDPKGIGDWLNQLLQNLVIDLLAIGQDVLADLVESFRELITKFPFSIPWDIAAILALLVAEPQAPVIEVPQYTYTGLSLQQVGTYRIDLSQWNSVMDVVRPMETILFAGWLAFKTDFFKGLLEMTKG